MADTGKKFVPVTVSSIAELPAFTVDGFREATEGAGFELALITNSARPEFPPPGLGFVTLTVADPD
jgi:hypothetical protein